MINLTYKDFLFTDIIEYIPNWMWQELNAGLDNGIISKEEIIDYAKSILEEDIDNFEIVLEIAIADDNDDILPLINKLMRLESKKDDKEILDKWRFAILLYLYLNKDKYNNNVYEIIAETSADFNYPEDMDGFIYYKPADGIDMMVHWKNYLKNQCIQYNLTYPLDNELLTIQDIIDIHQECLKLQGSQLVGIRDINRLHSIIFQQNQSLFGIELYPSVYDKAGMLWESLSLSHIFVDGNKRVAFLSTIMILKLNEITINLANTNEMYNFAISIIINHVDVENIKRYLVDNSYKTKMINNISHREALEEILQNKDILKIVHLLAQ